ncbi:hypothetical protein CIHG_00125 [Coccidioides immitis H538.4]|uniref:Uncharacterized protein n=1 Tax=Coccidioides immitis H538.4 TaxID=396776 RepID=A0A0J8RCT5_COCIT|nr:hypothetical protein CIHG_00125 [Coccidioides immitis H538.4]
MISEIHCERRRSITGQHEACVKAKRPASTARCTGFDVSARLVGPFIGCLLLTMQLFLGPGIQIITKCSFCIDKENSKWTVGGPDLKGLSCPAGRGPCCQVCDAVSRVSHRFFNGPSSLHSLGDFHDPTPDVPRSQSAPKTFGPERSRPMEGFTKTADSYYHAHLLANSSYLETQFIVFRQLT